MGIDFGSNYDYWLQQLSLSTPESLSYLNQIQDSKEAWNLAFNLLENQNLTLKFYGAHTLFHKIARNWNQLQLEQTTELGSRIIQLIQSLNQQKLTQSGSDQLFNPTIRKLLQTLVWYQFYTFQQIEKQDFIQTTLSQFPLSDNLELAVCNELIKLDYLKLIPEEHLSAPSSLASKSVGITDYLHKSVDSILSILQPHLMQKSLEPNQDLLFQKSLATLQSWTTFGLPIESIPNIVQLLIQQLNFKDRIFPIGKTLQEILSHPNSFKVQSTLFGILLPTLCHPSLLSFISELHQSDSDHDSVLPLCQLYVDFCETFSEMIMEKIIYENNNQVYSILEALLSFTNYPGLCPSEQTITEECLLVWVTLQDSYQTLDEDSYNRPNQVANKDGALNFFKRLLDVLLVKTQFPVEEELSDWSQNDHYIFKVFRRDVGDLFINTYYLMGSEMAKYYFGQANQLISHLAQQPNNQDSWQSLESILHLILKISESMNDNIPPLPEIAQFFQNQTLELLIEGKFSSVYLKQTIFKIIGEYALYIKDNHQLLVLSISKSLSVLANNQLAQAATSAFGKLCNIARDDLVNSIGDLINTYLSIAHNITPELLDKILKGLFNILYKLYAIDSNKFQLEMDRVISNLLDIIEQTIVQGKVGDFSNLTIGSPTLETSPKDLWIEQLVQRIHNLTACCNGLKPSSEFDLSELAVDTLQLPQSIMSPLCQRLYMALAECLSLVGGQEVMVEAISRLTAAGLDTDGIAVPFVFPLSSLLEMVINNYLAHPHINSYLSWFNRIVNIYGSSSNMSLKSQLFFNNNLTQEQPQPQYDDGLLAQALQKVLPAFFGIVTDLNSMEVDLDLSLSMVNLLSRFIKCDLKSILTLPSHLIDSIFMFNLTGLSVQNRFLLKAHLGLSVDLLSSHKEEDILIQKFPQVKFIRLSSLIQEQGIGKLILDKLLLGIGKDTPKSCIVNVTEVLHHLLLNCKGLANQWIRELLSQESYPTNLVDSKTKDQFISKLLITTSLKERKRLCEMFSLSCRGYNL